MDRLKGLGSFILITAGVLFTLRAMHVSIPLVFPETRQGPIAVASLNEARQRVGFAPMIPAYRPQALGSQPASLRVELSPTPTFVIVWREGDRYLSVTQRQGGPRPAHPPSARPLADVADSTWWVEGSRNRLIVARGEFWIELDTNLSERELRRFVDTLAPY